MANFRDAAGRVARFAADKAKGAAAVTANKTKTISRIAKLNVDIASERDTIKQAYSEIGKLYFETHRDDPDSYFLQPCQEIENALEAIAAMESEIARLKTAEHSLGRKQPEVEVEIVEEEPAQTVSIPVTAPEEPASDAPEETGEES